MKVLPTTNPGPKVCQKLQLWLKEGPCVFTRYISPNAQKSKDHSKKPSADSDVK